MPRKKGADLISVLPGLSVGRGDVEVQEIQ
jgi:hypothetical protein